MKLWVDDIRPIPDDSWTLAKTVNEAIRALYLFDWDEVSLDHDISHQVTVGENSRPYPCEETFEAVAHYIAAKYKILNKVPKITLHTANPNGAERMKRLLALEGISSEIKGLPPVNRLEQVGLNRGG